MKKRHLIENEFNEHLMDQEFLLKFNGDNELIIIGAPGGKLISRMAISIVGVLLVFSCLVTGGQSGQYTTTFTIGGSLLGLILASTPFISFYSRKYFKVLVSKKLKHISITSGVSSPDTRVDFSNIDHLQLKHLQIDDLISGSEDKETISYLHTYTAIADGKRIELFTLASHDESFKSFAEKFGIFLSTFIDTELKLTLA